MAVERPDEKPGMPEDEQVKTDVKEIQKAPELPVPVIVFSQKRDIQNHCLQLIPESEVDSLPSIREFVNRTPSIEFPP